MKSEKSVLRLAASAPADWTGGLDDNSRFANVVMPHIDDAYRLARWLTGNSTDAEDVVQDASLRAFRAIRGFAGGSARAWLLSIVRNTAYSWLRKNRPAAVVTVDDLEAVELAQVNPGDPDTPTPEAALLAKIDAEQLRAAIAALPAPFRETLVLRDIEGLDYREIAQATTAVPPYVLEQRDVAAAAHRSFALRFTDFERLARVFKTSGIRRRYAVRPIEWYTGACAATD